MSARTALLAIAAGIYLALRNQAERPVKSLMPATELSPERPALPQRRPTDLSAHPSVARIRDQIAANEAARIDAEWEAMNA